MILLYTPPESWASPSEQKVIDEMMKVLENDIVMSSSLFMLITYYSVMTDTYECDWHD